MTSHNIAVVGCGGVSGMHFTGYAAHPDRVRVVAACDPVAERRDWARDTYGVSETFDSIEELLEHGGFTAAVVCTPSTVRESALKALAAAGIHIFVEKPMADTYAEAVRAVEVCADAGVLLAVNQNFRYHYAFGIAAGLVRDGAIGAVRSIAHQDLTFRQDKGWRIQSPRHALSVMGVHWFDGFRQLIGSDADQISCRTFSAPAINCVGETDASVSIDFGAVPVSYVQSFSSRYSHTETIVVGESGTLRFDYGQLTRIDADKRETVFTNPHSGPGKPESTFLGLAALLDAIENGDEPANSGQDNLKTISLLDGAYRSATERQPVRLTGGLLP